MQVVSELSVIPSCVREIAARSQLLQPPNRLLQIPGEAPSRSAESPPSMPAPIRLQAGKIRESGTGGSLVQRVPYHYHWVINAIMISYLAGEPVSAK